MYHVSRDDFSELPMTVQRSTLYIDGGGKCHDNPTYVKKQLLQRIIFQPQSYLRGELIGLFGERPPCLERL